MGLVNTGSTRTSRAHLVEEHWELLVPRVAVLLEHSPPQLGPLVDNDLAPVTVGGAVHQELCGGGGEGRLY